MGYPHHGSAVDDGRNEERGEKKRRPTKLPMVKKGSFKVALVLGTYQDIIIPNYLFTLNNTWLSHIVDGV